MWISNRIGFNSKNPTILKWYPINYLDKDWYDTYSQLPQIFTFDDILLPQDIT
ncbi:MAG: hypothetical protein LBU14_04015 [Candidatus Peribacteria bacterium]|nr:hypothetical protein [Candidatus Peribacteria bacterium]